VSHAWRAVVGPNQVLFIGLLAVFEAAVGVLILSGGRRTRLGYAAVIAFYLTLAPCSDGSKPWGFSSCSYRWRCC